MLSNKSHNVSYNAQSTLKIENEDVKVADFGAYLNEEDDQGLNFSLTIADTDLYKQNLQIVLTDYAEFQNYVLGDI